MTMVLSAWARLQQFKAVRPIFVVLLTACLFGCAMTYGPKFEPINLNPEQSLVYVYRIPTISGSAMSAKPMVIVNGKEYRTIKNGGYFPIVLEPGSHDVALKSTLFGSSIGEERMPAKFQIKPGETKYFEYAQITTGYNRYGNTEVAAVEEHFVEVPAIYAEKQIKKTRLLSVD